MASKVLLLICLVALLRLHWAFPLPVADGKMCRFIYDYILSGMVEGISMIQNPMLVCQLTSANAICCFICTLQWNIIIH